MDPGVRNWLRLAEYDLATAKAMLEAGRTLYVVFACQQAAEKALKALLAATAPVLPPRTHDLLVLAKQAKLGLSDEHADLVTYLNQAFIVVRYPTDIDEAMASFPLEAVSALPERTREFVAWIQSRLTSSTS